MEIPQSLKCFYELALLYGMQDGEERDRLQNVLYEDVARYDEFVRRVDAFNEKTLEALDAFLDEYCLTEHDESCAMYFFAHFLDEMDLLPGQS